MPNTLLKSLASARITPLGKYADGSETCERYEVAFENDNIPYDLKVAADLAYTDNKDIIVHLKNFGDRMTFVLTKTDDRNLPLLSVRIPVADTDIQPIQQLLLSR